MAAGIISVVGLGLGLSIRALQASHQRSDMISLGVSVESTLISAIQDPSNYSTAVTDALQAGNPPSNFKLPVPMDSSMGKPFSIAPGETLYFTPDMCPCGGYSSTAVCNGQKQECALMVGLSNWQANVPTTGLYSLAYSIQSNPKYAAIAPIGNPDFTFLSPSAYVVIVPAASNSGSMVKCSAANAIGTLGIGKDGQAICLYYPDSKLACVDGEIPKGFNVTPDPVDPHTYYLGFNCSPVRQIACANPGYSFENFVPSALDPSPSNPVAPVGKCVYIEEAATVPISVPGTDGIKVTQACASSYVINSPSCTMGVALGTPTTCTDGSIMKPDTTNIDTVLVSKNQTIICQAEMATQACCANNASQCAQVSVPLTLTYNCVLDPVYADQVVY